MTVLKNEVESLQRFIEVSLQGKSNQFIIHHTGLPNLHILKAPKNSPPGAKLAPFQEFMVVMLKLRLNASSHRKILHINLMCMPLQFREYC